MTGAGAFGLKKRGREGSFGAKGRYRIIEKEKSFSRNRRIFTWAAVAAAAALLTGLAIWRLGVTREEKSHTSVGFAMSTIILQTAYGPRAEACMQAVEDALDAEEDKFSLYRDTSPIARINAAAGQEPVAVDGEVLSLLKTSLTLSAVSDGKFCITIAPLTELWGITSDHPKVPSEAGLQAVLPLLNDQDVVLDEAAGTVFLRREGQAVDLGGIAKGYSCDAVSAIYDKYNVKSALLSIGGNVYVHGTRPDGTLFRIGFRDPAGSEESYIASVQLQDQVFAVSGGYERYFVENGVTYQHILDPATGYPVKTDVVSVGVVSKNGTQADFWSTTLYCWGRDKVLEWMKTAEENVLLLDDQGTLYVSASLRSSFRSEKDGLNVVFVERESS